MPADTNASTRYSDPSKSRKEAKMHHWTDERFPIDSRISGCRSVFPGTSQEAKQ
jgi:hypothetical protein